MGPLMKMGQPNKPRRCDLRESVRAEVSGDASSIDARTRLAVPPAAHCERLIVRSAMPASLRGAFGVPGPWVCECMACTPNLLSCPSETAWGFGSAVCGLRQPRDCRS